MATGEKTVRKPARRAPALGINVLDVLQSKQFESDIVGAANGLSVNDAARIRKYRYGNGIWKAADIAAEYRRILTKESEEPSTVRSIIADVGKRALSVTLYRMGAKPGAQIVRKKPVRKQG